MRPDTRAPRACGGGQVDHAPESFVPASSESVGCWRDEGEMPFGFIKGQLLIHSLVCVFRCSVLRAARTALMATRGFLPDACPYVTACQVVAIIDRHACDSLLYPSAPVAFSCCRLLLQVSTYFIDVGYVLPDWMSHCRVEKGRSQGASMFSSRDAILLCGKCLWHMYPRPVATFVWFLHRGLSLSVSSQSARTLVKCSAEAARNVPTMLCSLNADARVCSRCLHEVWTPP